VPLVLLTYLQTHNFTGRVELIALPTPWLLLAWVITIACHDISDSH